jgi:hypothetical protein
MLAKSTRPIVIAAAFFFLLLPVIVDAAYHVAVGGDDNTGDGTSGAPWATITKALDSVPDGSVVLVHSGTYNGRVRIRGTFSDGVVVRAEPAYHARLRHTGTVITSYGNNVRGITIEGFDIAHSGAGAEALVVHIDGGGSNQVSNITIRNNILHDSYNNDILKINNAATNILVEKNIFYNQSGSDEHIDLNSVNNVTVKNNVFFNDFGGSGRSNGNDTSSYIVIKDSNGGSDIFLGSRYVNIQGNIFLNWQGSSGSNFVLVGEDGKPYFEGEDIIVENNLMLGNSANVMRAPFGVKGGRNILFRNNTITGDLPALAYAMRLNREGSNPANQNIQFYNNIWADQTGTMGARDPSDSNDFSDTPVGETTSFALVNNLYWNGGQPLPYNGSELINYTDDNSGIIGNPQLSPPVAVALPRWDQSSNRFGDGSTTTSAVFVNLVSRCCTLARNSRAVNAAYGAQAPAMDILGNPRPAGGGSDVGACEFVGGGSIAAPLINLLLQDE